MSTESVFGRFSGVGGGLARRVLWSLPGPAKRRLSELYRVVNPPNRPSPEEIVFPPDVADREDLLSFLSDTDVFGPATEEGDAYLSHALERFRITLAMTPTLSSGAKALELGSNPYFFTRMLERRGIDVTCANWFGDQADIGARGRQTVTSPRSGDTRTFEFDHFNIELDRFPYLDQSFSAVFFCEILEHLPLDPVNALAEIHRVLEKPGGILILSTPNPARTENLVKMLSGENVYEPLSGYGVHGRHNREYTVSELRVLLSELGFEVRRMFTADVSPSPPPLPTSLYGVELADRWEYVFVVAEAVGEERWRYPDWLYQSRHALSRAVLPNMEVGRNDDLQSHGLHARETIQDRDVRWMGKEGEVRVLLSPQFQGPASLIIEGVAPPSQLDGEISLFAELLGGTISAAISCGSNWFSLKLPVHVESGDQQIRLRTDRTWRPVDLGMSPDERELSLAISAVGLEPRP